MWIWLVLLYGLLKGGREIVKKKSLEKNTVLEVLILYTLLSFVFILPTVPKAGGVEWKIMIFIALKSLVIFTAWILSFKAIKQMPVSLYGIIDLSRVVFATVLGVLVIGETMTPAGIVGLILVCVGLVLCNTKKSSEKEKVQAKIIIYTLISCLFNAISGVMDKILTRSITSTQLQFWYTLFLVIYYLLYILVTREKIRFVSAVKNYWIWILAIMFVIGDKALFIANQMPESRVTVMTLIKQSCCIVTILAGKLVFKEKNIAFKLFCAFIIISGIVISTIF
ncbi:MAG: EamA family transporter [Lachnospiraceae bacterium]|nr:EamA family transporter [Lachnospiraceae bacterium]